jgi:RimJ/RimL family protein N-acetyltransferase
MFHESAKAVVDFALETVRVHRLEARASVSNGRGHGQYVDQILWTIVAEDWPAKQAWQAKTVWGSRIH